jgi:large subunit ribosomal protein L30
MAYALVRARGTVNVNGKIQDTMTFLRLQRPNFATVIPSKDASYEGMVKRAKDYITYGEVDADTLTALLTARGRTTGDKPLDDAFVAKATDGKYGTIADFAKAVAADEATLKDLGPDFKTYFRMHPPVGGWGAIKRHYTVGGALGYRGKEINKLVKRMMEQPEQGATPKQGA